MGTLDRTGRALPPDVTTRPGSLRMQFGVMGTQASLVIATHNLAEPCDATSVALDVQEVLVAADERFSPFRDDSELVRFRAGRTTNPSPQFVQVMDHCLRLESKTRAAFDPHDLTGRFDPTGYVKGWAVERAVGVAVECGASDVCVTVGGDVRTAGMATVDRPWRIAVRSPSSPGAVAALVTPVTAGAPLAVATSGEYERGAHIWAAAAPRPLADRGRSQLGSVTVVGPDLGLADAYSTAIWARAKTSGAAGGLEVLDEIPGFEAVIITMDQRLLPTAGFPEFMVGSQP
jgi:thiamine biosynthesis lipoprotein